MTNKEILINLANVLEHNLLDIARANTYDVLTCFDTNADNVKRAISSIRQFAKKDIFYKNKQHGVAIYSCYGDPSFGLFGMSLAPALLSIDASMPILIGFPEILKNYGRLIEKIITNSKLLPNVRFVFGAKKFMEQTLSDKQIKHCLVFGEQWVNKYIDSFRYKKSLTYYGPGNNAAIILPDADIDTAVDKILKSAFILSGQAAVCINRCIVDSRLNKKDVLSVFNKKLKQITYGFDTKTNYVTPLAIEPLVIQANERIKSIKQTQGSVINYSVTQKNNSWLISPSLVHLQQSNLPIWKKYHFAPILPIIFKDFDDIANETNLTDYGIYTALWGNKNDINSLKLELYKGHILVLENKSILDIITTDNGYTGAWGGYKKSGFCMSKLTNWEVKEGAFDFYKTID